MLAALATSLAGAFAPDFTAGAHTHATRLRKDLLANYDAMVPPASDRLSAGSEYSGTGTDVTLEVRFFKVVTVRPSDGTLVLKVWMRMGWTDERLQWDPASYGGLTTVYFRGDATEQAMSSEIWAPDIQTYNGLQGTTLTLEPSAVKVKSDGAVFQSRPGLLEVMCKVTACGHTGGVHNTRVHPFSDTSTPLEAAWLLLAASPRTHSRPPPASFPASCAFRTTTSCAASRLAGGVGVAATKASVSEAALATPSPRRSLPRARCARLGRLYGDSKPLKPPPSLRHHPRSPELPCGSLVALLWLRLVAHAAFNVPHTLAVRTRSQSYQEFDIINVSSLLRVYDYPNYPSEPWPVGTLDMLRPNP